MILNDPFWIGIKRASLNFYFYESKTDSMDEDSIQFIMIITPAIYSRPFIFLIPRPSIATLQSLLTQNQDEKQFQKTFL